jgi:hypothetical protein
MERNIGENMSLQTKCIYCTQKYQKDNNKVVDLGEIYPSLFIDSPAQTKMLKKEELSLVQCPFCGFVQLSNILEPDAMYRKYWYRSGLNNSMVESLHDIVEKAAYRKSFYYSNKCVMDIGCNDGTLLSFYPDDFFKVGFDPANNLAEHAIKNCDVFVNDYFNGKICFKNSFDIITSIAMFYDLERPTDFIKDIKKYLSKDGVWIIQMTDLTCTLKVNAYDNICHEHLAYYTLKQLNYLLISKGLEIFDVEYNDVNGGSVRAYVCHRGQKKVTSCVENALKEEEEILKNKDWKYFNNKINHINTSTKSFIEQANKEGKKVFGLGASTKGNTLLQCCGLTGKDIPYILEVSKDKFGKFCAGSNIEIIDEARGFSMKPDYLLVLPWHFTNFFLEKKIDYLKNGGKLLVPMPEPGVWSYEDGKVVFNDL